MGSCAVLNSVSLRGLQKCSFASVTLHKTHANFNTDLGNPISSFTVFFVSLFVFPVTITVSFCCCWFALHLHSFCWAVFKGRGTFPAPKKSKAEEESGGKLPYVRLLVCEHLACGGELSSPGLSQSPMLFCPVPPRGCQTCFLCSEL